MKLELCDLVDGELTPPRQATEHSIATFADETIRFLKEHKGGPFFAYVPFDAPHDPHIVPPYFAFDYQPAQIPLPPNFLPQHPWNNGEMTIRDEQLMPWPRTPDGVRAYLAEYYRYITFLDEQIGRIMKALADSPYATNTIIVFSADSGVACGSHGLIGKQNCYEHSLRVPLLIAGPGIAADRRTEAMCYLFDVLPTLGDICGIAPPDGSEGISLRAILADPSRTVRRSLIFAYRDVQRAYCNDRWKLIRYPQVDKVQLFDLPSDPYETNNLADKPEFAWKVAELTADLKRQMKKNGDRGLLEVADPKPAAWSPPPLVKPAMTKTTKSAK